MLKNFKDLNVRQKAYKFCLNIYKTTQDLPIGEKYGLSSQTRRAVVSIPLNIAEGYGRKTSLDYTRSFYRAYGSQCELETQPFLSGDLEYIKIVTREKFLEKISEIERMFNALIKSLENKT